MNIVIAKAEGYTCSCTEIHKQMRDDMMKKALTMVLLMMVAMLIAACGTQATPVFEAPDEEDIIESQSADSDVEVAVVPTETAAPTATPTDEPTAVPTVVPTEAPTEEPTAAPLDPVARLVASRDPADGEALFNQMFAETGFACATCHHVDQEGTKIGPSLLNVKDIAGTRVEGQGAERYLYNSIIHPNDYIVEGFVEGVMPQTWGDVLSDTEIYDIIAYMLTLEG